MPITTLRERRAENVQGAFRVPEEKRIALKGKKAILIDDVLTTGATADACTKALLRAGALPAKMDFLEERTIGPELGADSIEAGIALSREVITSGAALARMEEFVAVTKRLGQ